MMQKKVQEGEQANKTLFSNIETLKNDVGQVQAGLGKIKEEMDRAEEKANTMTRESFVMKDSINSMGGRVDGIGKQLGELEGKIKQGTATLNEAKNNITVARSSIDTITQ